MRNNVGAAFSQRARGYALANKGHNTRTLQAYLGHRNIQYTVRYTYRSSMGWQKLPNARLYLH